MFKILMIYSLDKRVVPWFNQGYNNCEAFNRNGVFEEN